MKEFVQVNGRQLQKKPSVKHYEKIIKGEGFGRHDEYHAVVGTYFMIG